MFVYKGNGFTARDTIRSALRRPDAAVPRFDLAPGAYLRLLDRARLQR
jgi:hypothetical protein